MKINVSEERISKKLESMNAISDCIDPIVLHEIDKNGIKDAIDSLVLYIFRLSFHCGLDAREYQEVMKGYAEKIPGMWESFATDILDEQKLH